MVNRKTYCIIETFQSNLTLHFNFYHKMRNLLIIIFFLFLMSCKDDNLNNQGLSLKQGIYEGSFQCDTILIWESIGITDYNFEEYASGGVLHQKYPLVALTKGTYKIFKETISFYNIQIAQPPNGKLGDYQSEFLLIGDYTVNSYSDSTVQFWKNSVKGKQEYNLKKSFPNN
jgi:hypothetical protein